MNFQLKQHFQIESARFLPKLPKTHPCSQIHGHSFKISLILVGPLSDIGWVQDYNDIKKVFEPILKLIDHKLLNEVPGLENPTTELLCLWLYNKLKPELSNLQQVEISETTDSSCSYPVLK